MISEILLHPKTNVIAKVIEEVMLAGGQVPDAAIEVYRALDILDTVLASGAEEDVVEETVNRWMEVFYGGGENAG